jgi:hypothetical protein
VPADRYFGAAPEVLRTLRARVASNALELARHGLPRAPFYVTGQVGGQPFRNLGHLRGLANLQTLDLVGTRVTDAGLEPLKGLANLQRLFLQATQVTDTGLGCLKGLAVFWRKLNLHRAKMTDAGLAQEAFSLYTVYAGHIDCAASTPRRSPLANPARPLAPPVDGPSRARPVAR